MTTSESNNKQRPSAAVSVSVPVCNCTRVKSAFLRLSLCKSHSDRNLSQVTSFRVAASVVTLLPSFKRPQLSDSSSSSKQANEASSSAEQPELGRLRPETRRHTSQVSLVKSCDPEHQQQQQLCRSEKRRPRRRRILMDAK